MLKIDEIIQAIISSRVYITSHADEELQEDHLRMEEVYYSVIHGEIIENYPTDWPYPSCLIYGHSFNEAPIHSVWAYNTKTKYAVLITVYRPDPGKWTNGHKRRKS